MSGRARLLVFDLDGTLVDSSRDLATGLNAALLRLRPGTPPLSLEAVRSFIGGGARVLVSRSVAALSFEDPPEVVLPVFLEEYSRVLLDTTRFYPGVESALDRLRDRALAVLTNKPGPFSRDILAGLGAAGRFVRILGGGDLPTKKPNPEGLRLLMDAAGVLPRETVMIGDSAIDVETGRAAGVFTVGVLCGFDPAGLRRRPPDALLPGLSELPALLAAREGSGAVRGDPPVRMC